MTHLQIPHWTGWIAYLSNDIKHEVCLRHLRLWTLHQIQKQRLIPTTLKFGNAFTKIKRPWSHSVDTNHHFLHVKFEVRFIIFFSSKPMPNEKWHFSWGMAHPFSKGGGWKTRELFGFFLNWTVPHGACVNRVPKAKQQVEKWDSLIHTLYIEWNPYCTQMYTKKRQARARPALYAL
jgi:hypothetical protein